MQQPASPNPHPHPPRHPPPASPAYPAPPRSAPSPSQSFTSFACLALSLVSSSSASSYSPYFAAQPSPFQSKDVLDRKNALRLHSTRERGYMCDCGFVWAAQYARTGVHVRLWVRMVVVAEDCTLLPAQLRLRLLCCSRCWAVQHSSYFLQHIRR